MYGAIGMGIDLASIFFIECGHPIKNEYWKITTGGAVASSQAVGLRHSQTSARHCLQHHISL